MPANADIGTNAVAANIAAASFMMYGVDVEYEDQLGVEWVSNNVEGGGRISRNIVIEYHVMRGISWFVPHQYRTNSVLGVIPHVSKRRFNFKCLSSSRGE